jgi:arsenic resistance protein ArsH
MSIFRALPRTALRINKTPFGRRSFALSRTMGTVANGDLNNTAAERNRVQLTADPAYRHASLALTPATDDAEVRSSYRPFLQDDAPPSQDWVSELELSTVLKMVDQKVLQAGQDRLKVLVLYGSMRKR